AGEVRRVALRGGQAGAVDERAQAAAAVVVAAEGGAGRGVEGEVGVHGARLARLGAALDDLGAHRLAGGDDDGVVVDGVVGGVVAEHVGVGAGELGGLGAHVVGLDLAAAIDLEPGLEHVGGDGGGVAALLDGDVPGAGGEVQEQRRAGGDAAVVVGVDLV